VAHPVTHENISEPLQPPKQPQISRIPQIKTEYRADCKTPGILNEVRLWPFWAASQSRVALSNPVAESNVRVSAAISDKAPLSHLGVAFGAASATNYSFHSSN